MRRLRTRTRVCASSVRIRISTIAPNSSVKPPSDSSNGSSTAAAPSNARWQERWEDAIAQAGLPVHRMPSGAGHDAMKLHTRVPQAMLFVRGQNGGISHNPLESTTNGDVQLAFEAFMHLLDALDDEMRESVATGASPAVSAAPALQR